MFISDCYPRVISVLDVTFPILVEMPILDKRRNYGFIPASLHIILGFAFLKGVVSTGGQPDP